MFNVSKCNLKQIIEKQYSHSFTMTNEIVQTMPPGNCMVNTTPRVFLKTKLSHTYSHMLVKQKTEVLGFKFILDEYCSVFVLFSSEC